MSVATIEEAIDDIRQGKMVILVDDEDRENEGDLTLAAEAATPENINFMAKYGRGLICLTLTSEKCDELGLRPMVRDNTSPFETAFTISIEAKHGVTRRADDVIQMREATDIRKSIWRHGPATGPYWLRLRVDACESLGKRGQIARN